MALAYNDPDILALIQNGSAGNGPPANTKPQTDFADAQPAADDDISTFAKTGKFDFKKMIDSILEDLLRLALNNIWGQLANGLLGGAGGVGGGMGWLGKLFGFATGGEFTVGGHGGTDSQIVAFKATPGEHVEVSTPQQKSAKDESGGGAATTAAAAPQVNVRVVNVTDPRQALDAMSSAEGERVILNMVQRNPRAFKSILGVQ